MMVATRARATWSGLLAAILVLAGGPVGGQEPAGLESWLDAATTELTALSAATDEELATSGMQRLLRVYLDAYEPIEGWYGQGAPYAVEPLSSLVMQGEATFHAALASRDPATMREAMDRLRGELRAIHEAALRAGVELVPDAAALQLTGAAPRLDPATLRTAEIRSIVDQIRAAENAQASGRTREALTLVEQAYLQSFEPIEARLPGPVTRKVESLIHLRLRPLLSQGAPASETTPVFAALYAGLGEADTALAGEPSFFFGAFNAFAIILREGLEAVLLIAAILAYLSGIGAPAKQRRRIWAGATAGVVASFGTWILARTLVPVSGASREILEGVTALIAVAVLIYVSNWLFQKTYIHDWKNYLRERVGHAVTTGSALAMAGLAFAAVYREGFETVLFYQALIYDASGTAVLAGFAPGMVLILAIGYLILRAGVKLPLRKLFALTNTVLLYLAFVFVGKGLYNLQEAGLFAVHPLPWLPDHDALRQLLGFYPVAETLLAQLAFLGLIAGTYLYYRRRMAAAAPAAPAPAPVKREQPVAVAASGSNT